MEIIFVYNADSGLFNGLKDTLHKTFAPKTYECNLCMVSFGAFDMKKEWKIFIDSLSQDVTFLHKDEFEKKYGENNLELPAVFKIENNKPKELISAKKINKIKTVQELINLVKVTLNL
jgi:hypothetical protein